MQYINKYKSQLALILFCTSLLIIRMWQTQSLQYIFLEWNLFLAIVPIYFARLFNKSDIKYFGLLWFLLWLLFFPNAPYIITDLIHISKKNKIAPVWFDTLMIASFAFTGLIIGLLSIQIIQTKLLKYFSKAKTKIILIGSLLLSGYGVYIGRFGRFNSWDIVSNPITLINFTVNTIVHPIVNSQVVVISILFSIFILLVYNALDGISNKN
jgi:uncharacterized membrane protein